MSITRRALLAWAAQASRPNILLLIADNWAWPHAGAGGDPQLRTPTFDRLAAEGALFTNAFAPTPSCSPSRSGLLTGQEVHRLGSAANLYGDLAPDFPTYPDLLEKSGYTAAYSGKGWAPGSPEKSGWRRNPAGVQVEGLPRQRPFCYWFGSSDPHVPWNRGQERKASLRADRVRVPAHLPDRTEVRDDILNYYCEVEQFDRECGQWIEQLRSAGELDNTFVVMTSDNGWQMPRGLANCYDLGVRIPMAIRWPAGFKRGTRRDDYVSLTSLMPAFLEAARVPVPKTATARSLLSGQRLDHMFLERERHANVRRGDMAYPVRGIRTRDFLYLWNIEPDRWPAGDPEPHWSVGPYGDIDDSQSKRLLMKEKPQPFFDLCMGKRPAEELYHLASDPDQVRNLAGQTAHARVQQELRARVQAWMKSTNDPRAAGATGFWDRVPFTGPRGRW